MKIKNRIELNETAREGSISLEDFACSVLAIIRDNHGYRDFDKKNIVELSKKVKNIDEIMEQIDYLPEPNTTKVTVDETNRLIDDFLNERITEESFLFFKASTGYNRLEEDECRKLLKYCSENSKYLVIVHDKDLDQMSQLCIRLGHFAVNSYGKVTKEYASLTNEEYLLIKSAFLKFNNKCM